MGVLTEDILTNGVSSIEEFREISKELTLEGVPKALAEFVLLALIPNNQSFIEKMNVYTGGKLEKWFVEVKENKVYWHIVGDNPNTVIIGDITPENIKKAYNICNVRIKDEEELYKHIKYLLSPVSEEKIKLLLKQVDEVIRLCTDNVYKQLINNPRFIQLSEEYKQNAIKRFIESSDENKVLAAIEIIKTIKKSDMDMYRNSYNGVNLFQSLSSILINEGQGLCLPIAVTVNFILKMMGIDNNVVELVERFSRKITLHSYIYLKYENIEIELDPSSMSSVAGHYLKIDNGRITGYKDDIYYRYKITTLSSEQLFASISMNSMVNNQKYGLKYFYDLEPYLKGIPVEVTYYVEKFQLFKKIDVPNGDQYQEILQDFEAVWNTYKDIPGFKFGLGEDTDSDETIKEILMIYQEAKEKGYIDADQFRSFIKELLSRIDK